jgi:hypothetical protein
MKNETKSARFSMRVSPIVLARLKEMAEELGCPLQDLLVVGAFSFHAHTLTPEKYLTSKAEFLVSQIVKKGNANR